MHLINKDKSGPSRQKGPSQADTLALNWLEGHMRIMGFWMDRLVSENGDELLINTLHRQSRWLQEMTEVIGKDR